VSKPDKTRVYFTVDVECAEERVARGTIQPALGYDLRVWGRFANHDHELGVPLIMRELETYGHRGTFFVEPFGARHFGIDGLTSVCRAMRARGHDVQLHAHPVQKEPRFRSLGLTPENDNLHARDLAGQAALLAEGLAILAQAGVPRAEVRAFRAGNFGADNQTWQAMTQVGLQVSSNLNANYLHRNCKISWPRSETGLFDTGAGVWELPISNFLDGNRPRHLQLMAVSLRELVAYLYAARANGIGEVNIFTHSFELFYIEDVARKRARLNTLNLARLRGLCRFLREHEDEFSVDTVGDLARRLREGETRVIHSPTQLPRGKPLYRYQRMVEQLLKRVTSGFKVQSHYYS
jgi:hypothetical protein